MPNAMIQPMASVVAETSWAFDEMVQARMKNQLNSFQKMQAETNLRTEAYQSQRAAATANGEAQKNGLLMQAAGTFGEASSNLAGGVGEFAHDAYKSSKVIGPAQAKVNKCADFETAIQNNAAAAFVQNGNGQFPVQPANNPNLVAEVRAQMGEMGDDAFTLDAVPVGGGLTVRQKINQLNVADQQDVLKEVRVQKKYLQKTVDAANADKEVWNKRINVLSNSTGKYFEAGFRMQQAAYAAEQARWQGDQALWQADTSMWDSAFKGMDTMQDSSTQSISAIYRMRAEIAAANHA